MSIFKDKKRGTALLVVLGFLAFITVSAVAFAVYMRVERQATSTYMHSLSARHLLETGLYRAIDEIDAELRVEDRNSRFPDWTTRNGRVSRIRASPADTKATNDKDAKGDNRREARVLSPEALGFLPAILVNDVRFNAILTRDNLDTDVIPGAKWRSLSMPIQSAIRINSNTDCVATNSGLESPVGRYSYICVNLSDMIDVNDASVLARSVSNGVNIAHLFTDPEAFQKQRSNDVYYATLQDFYNCMQPGKASTQQYFAPGANYGDTTDSPYQTFLRNNSAKDYAFNGAENHVLTTGGMAKPEPRKERDGFKPCNFLQTPPLVDLNASDPKLSPEFKAALQATFPAGGLPNGRTEMVEAIDASALSSAFATMLADYLAPDNTIPRRVDVPSVKLAPMVSQILIPNFMAPKYYVETKQGTPSTTTVYAQLIGGGIGTIGNTLSDAKLAAANSGIKVRLCWPFKDLPPGRSTDSFTVEAAGWLRYERADTDFKTMSFPSRANTPTSTYLRFTTTKPYEFTPSTVTSMEDASFYTSADIGITFEASDDELTPTLATVAGDTTPQAEGFRTALIVYVWVKEKQSNTVVDFMPQYRYTLPPATLNDISDADFELTPKIYFQSFFSGMIPGMSGKADGIPIEMEWYSLEVPDPRFNHRASNWVISGDRNNIPPIGISAIVRGFLGQDGRDSDIFMSVSNTGVLQSPGELGFIIRPYDFDQSKGRNGEGVHFRDRTGRDPTVDDSDAYYRTIRLYNHTGDGSAGDPVTQTHDPVFEYFYAANADGTCAGSKTRVNPLSPLDTVLEAAIHRTPNDYWTANQNCVDEKYQNNYIGNNKSAQWKLFVDAWLDALTFTVDTETVSRHTGLSAGRPYRSIRTVYPGLKDSWYAPPSTPGIPSQTIFGKDVGLPLCEVDRKMLYSFSLDAFSDRQQLFLYILQAERTAPAVGAETKSLAGGRAVALVWRDPYPKKRPEDDILTVNKDDALNYDRSSWYQLVNGFESTYAHLFRRSPWWQTRKEPPTGSSTSIVPEFRTDGYHEHQILFFKQLDN
ncbi:MAG: hypothetical protein FWH21_06175 [Kiritimatiellaeota bacterium]|nr:hypothetical protein [Kiritimatiellota bacterium]